MKKNRIVFSLILFFFAFPLSGEENPPRLLGIVVDIEGKAFLEKDGSKPEDYPISVGTRIYHGDIIFVERVGDGEAQLILLDWSTKNRISIPEGKNLLEAANKENKKNLAFLILEKYKKLFEDATISTGGTNPR